MVPARAFYSASQPLTSLLLSCKAPTIMIVTWEFGSINLTYNVSMLAGPLSICFWCNCPDISSDCCELELLYWRHLNRKVVTPFWSTLICLLSLFVLPPPFFSFWFVDFDIWPCLLLLTLIVIYVNQLRLCQLLRLRSGLPWSCYGLASCCIIVDLSAW